MIFKYPLKVQRKNVKNLSIKIYSDKHLITVIAPSNLSDIQINKFISEKESIIRKKIYFFEESGKLISLSDDEIFLLGEKYKLNADNNSNCIYTDFKEKSISGCTDILKDKNKLKQYYKNLAKNYITSFADRICEKHNIKINKIYIRDQKTSWGTCSTKKNLSFNFRLILCPEPVIKYLVYHEISHLFYMNHSKNFWALVESFYPDYKPQKKWLNTYSYSIRSII